MDFFEHQQKARGTTRWLILYLTLAVVLITLAINGAVYGVARLVGWFQEPLSVWMTEPWWILTSGLVLLVVLGTSLIRMGQLSSGGGKAVAEMVGATPVDRSTKDPALRRLINAVEEMSIASGVRQPALYVWQGESGINAFVAGLDPSQTVLVVTEGALEHLNRDQLQGVIGHEYSHIFNGDVRINTRLIGILAGVLLIGQAGLFVLRSMRYSGSSRSRNSGQAMLAVLALGAALSVIGFIGLFFGRLIQSAVSRQREFLADAAAVQYTRNPEGIAGALAVIGHHYWGGRVAAKHAEDMAHICFEETRKLTLMATHPPIKERIRRIAPGFRLQASQRKKIESAKAPPADKTPRQRPHRGINTAQLGRPTPEGLLYASALLASIPRPISSSLRNPRAAKAVVYSLLLAESQGGEEDGLLILQQQEGHDLKNLTANLLSLWRQQEKRLRLPVVELAIPHLKGLPLQEIDAFLERIDTLVKLDKKLSLFEYLLRVLLYSQLQDLDRVKKPGTRSLAQVERDALLLLSVLSHSGHEEDAVAGDAFNKAARELFGKEAQRLDESACRPTELHKALTALAQLAPLEKKKLLEAISACILHDEEISAEEAELLRAVCEVLEVPLPPLQAELSMEKTE